MSPGVAAAEYGNRQRHGEGHRRAVEERHARQRGVSERLYDPVVGLRVNECQKRVSRGSPATRARSLRGQARRERRRGRRRWCRLRESRPVTARAARVVGLRLSRLLPSVIRHVKAPEQNVNEERLPSRRARPAVRQRGGGGG